MATVHIPEAEAAADFARLMARVTEGAEVVIERDAVPFAVIRPVVPPGRSIADSIALLPQDSEGVMDDDFAADVQEFVDRHREPVQSADWD